MFLSLSNRVWGIMSSIAAGSIASWTATSLAQVELLNRRLRDCRHVQRTTALFTMLKQVLDLCFPAHISSNSLRQRGNFCQC